MSTSVDYTGRTVDLFIFQGMKTSGDVLILPGFDGDNGGKVISGVEKLAQAWAILFLTELGSIPADPTVGSSFIPHFRAGLIRDEGSVKSEFGTAAAQVYDLLLAAERASGVTPPADERLSSATLLRFNFDKVRSTLSLYVRLTTEAGTERVILLPVSVPIQ